MDVMSQGTVSVHVSRHTVSTSEGTPERPKASEWPSTCQGDPHSTPTLQASHLLIDRRTGLVATQEYKTASKEHIHVCTYLQASVYVTRMSDMME